MINLLLITPVFNNCCGVSKHVFLLINELKKINTIKTYFITGETDCPERISELNINYRVCSFVKDSGSVISTVKFLIMLFLYCRKYKIDLIHTHHRYPELIAWLIGKITKVRTISTAHSKVSGFKMISFKSDKIICISSYIKEILQKDFGRPESQLIVMYNFIHTYNLTSVNTASLKKKLKINEQSIIILFAGRFNRDKGIDLLVDAIKLIRKRHENVFLIMVGENEGSENLFVPTAYPYIKVIEPTDNIEEYYKISDVVVLPSRVESLGYVMLEAGINRVPFIGSDTGGISEFIRDRENGILFRNGDAADLCNAIDNCITDVELNCRVTEKLYEKVSQQCSGIHYMNKLFEIYKSVLNHDNKLA